VAHTNDTLAFYMTGKSFKKLIIKLIQHGIDSKKEIAIIENATMKNNKIYLESISESLLAWKDLQPESPSLIIIGSVLHYSTVNNTQNEETGMLLNYSIN
jgi:uroporphyrin-III C-methyltransferase